MSQNYDYILDINLAQLPNFVSMNSFFNTRTYIINPLGNSVNIQVNKSIVTSVLSYDYQKNIQNGVINYLPGNSSVTGNPDYATLSPVPSKFGYRMLEIIATKIFGDATDLIFVENGYSLYQTTSNSIITQIGNNIQNNFNNNVIKNTIFNIYANSPGFITTPGSYVFDFKNSVWQFPLYYSDTLKFDSGNLGSNFNGPDAGGSKFVNGIINIPILLKFYGPSVPSGTCVLILKAKNYSGSGSWNDESGNNKNATLENGTIATNQDNNGIILDGSTSWTFPNLSLGNAWTANVWWKNTGTPTGYAGGTYAAILCQIGTGTATNLNIGNNNNNSTFRASFYNNYNWYNGTDFTLTNGVWTNIQATWDGTTLTTYKNGASIGTTTPGNTSPDNGNNYRIGRRLDQPTYMVGEIGEVRIYTYALSASQVLADYQSSLSTFSGSIGVPLVSLTALTYSGTGTWNDDSGNSRNATKENGTIAKNTVGNGIILDGSTSWYFSDVNAGTSWTASVWFKATGTPGLTAQILTHEEGADINLSIGYTFYTTTYIAGGFFLADYGAYISTLPPYKITSNVWTNFTYTRNNSIFNLYVNGILYGTVTYTNTITDSTAPYLIGRSWTYYSPNNFVVGEIGEVIIYNQAISQSQITNHYNQTVSIYNSFNPSTISGCQLWLDGIDKSSLVLTGSTVTTWNDKSGNSNNGTAVGTPTFAPLTGITFNGSSDVFTLPNGALPFNDSSYDYYIVVNPTTIADGYKIINGGTENGNNSMITLFNNSFGTPYLCRQDWNYNAIDSAIPLTVGQNNLVEMSYTSGGNWTFIINFQSTTGSPGATRTQNNQGNTIGGGVNSFYPGSISEVIVYNTKLSTNQRQVVEGYLAWKWGFQSKIPSNHPYYKAPPLQSPFQLVSFNATTYSGTGAWNDDSGNGKNATVENGVAAKNAVGNGIVLNGSTNWKFDPIGNHPTWTILTWFKRTAPSQQLACLIVQPSGDGQTMALLSNGSVNSTNIGDDQFIGGFQDNVSWKANYVQTFVINEWHQMVVTWDGTNLRSYFDSTIQDTTNYTATVPIVNKFYRIGSRWDAATFVTGELGEISLYGYAISNSEIVSNYYSSIYKYIYFNPTSISGCQLWLDAFDPTTITLNGVPNVTSWKDKSGVGNNGTATGSITYSSNTITTNGGKFTTAYTTNPTAETMFVVCSLDATGAGSVIVIPSSSSAGRVLYVNSGNIAIGNNGVSNSVIGTTTVSTNTTLLYDYTLSSTATSLYYNASLDNSGGGTTFTGSTQTVIQPKTIKEIIFYNRVLTTYERQVVEGYLAWKWSINNLLPASHPFYGAFPSQTPFKPLVLLKAINYSGTGSWLDESGYGRNATLENGNIAKNVAGNGIVLDGSTSWTFPNVGISKVWTMNVWYKVTNSNVGNNTDIIFQIYNAGLDNFGREIRFNTGSPGTVVGTFQDQVTHQTREGTPISITTNVWTNIQVIYDGTNMITYKNGIFAGTVNIGDESIDNGNGYGIGRRYYGMPNIPNTYITGEIGEVRIYNYALTASQVLADYQSSLTTFTGILVSLTASTYSGSGPWFDDSGKGFNASLSTGSISKNTDGNGIVLDGSSYWTFPNVSAGNAWTLGVWYKNTGAPTGTSSGQAACIVTQEINQPVGNIVLGYEIDGNNAFPVLKGGFNRSTWYLGTNYTTTNNVWFYYAITWNGTTMTTYINGSSIGTTTPGGIGAIDGGLQYRIGRRYDNANYVVGEIGEVQIYNRPLTGGEITSHYNATLSTYSSILVSLTASTYSGTGTWNDDSGKGKNATLENGTIAKNGAGNGIVLDGSSNWIFNNVSAGNAWTVGVWYKKTGNNVGDCPTIITQQVGNGFINLAIGYPDLGSGPLLKGGFFSGLWKQGDLITLTTNVWTNIQITWNGTDMKTYIDGSLLGTTQPGGTAGDSGLQYRIGRRWDSADYVIGEIGEVQIYNRPLTGGEITSHYNATSASYQ